MSIMLIALFLVVLMVGVIMLLTPDNNSACNGDCRQGRDCNCVEKK